MAEPPVWRKEQHGLGATAEQEIGDAEKIIQVYEQREAQILLQWNLFFQTAACQCLVTSLALTSVKKKTGDTLASRSRTTITSKCYKTS